MSLLTNSGLALESLSTIGFLVSKFAYPVFVRSQLKAPPPVCRADLTGKVVMLIGANSGIGLEACKHFAQMNPARLILGCRSEARGAEAIHELHRETGYKGAELSLVDLADFGSVASFVERFRRSGRRLDVLVQNAAVMPRVGATTRTYDGWGTSLQINVIGPALLSLLLLPTLLRTAHEFKTEPRLVFVASENHSWVHVSEEMTAAPNLLKWVNEDESWCSTIGGTIERYSLTKLLNVLFVRALNDHLRGRPIIVNAVNPSYCDSGFRSSLPGIYGVGDRILTRLLARTSEEGSRQLVWGAVGMPVDGEIDRLRGAYISSGGVVSPSDWVCSLDAKRAQENLWVNLVNELKGNPTSPCWS